MPYSRNRADFSRMEIILLGLNRISVILLGCKPIASVLQSDVFQDGSIINQCGDNGIQKTSRMGGLNSRQVLVKVGPQFQFKPALTTPWVPLAICKNSK